MPVVSGRHAGIPPPNLSSRLPLTGCASPCPEGQIRDRKRPASAPAPEAEEGPPMERGVGIGFAPEPGRDGIGRRTLGRPPSRSRP